MSAPEEVAKEFVDAVAWGEHHKIWELLSEQGRQLVLKVGAARGMDDALVARLRAGTSATAEREQFLTDLVNGLRADLAGNDLDTLRAEVDPDGASADSPGSARIILVAPLPDVLQLPGLPAASVEMTEQGGEWRVDRLVPLTSQ